MKTIILSLILLATCDAAAQTGLLIPGGATAPDEKRLSTEEFDVDLLADNQHLRVRVIQIFRNLTGDQMEAKFVFALPESATVSDFAVWDGNSRIPGVMLEKRRAEKIYEGIKAAAIDPGILMTDDDGEGQKAFSARVFPIPAYGTKRVELEYRQPLAINDFASRVWFPLRPSSGTPAKIGVFNLRISVATEIAIREIAWNDASFPLTIENRGDCCFEASFRAPEFSPADDFSLEYKLKDDAGFLSFITYRMPEAISVFDLRNPASSETAADGFFEFRGLVPPTSNKALGPKAVLVAVDTSLSMQGERIRRAVEAAEDVLGALNEADRFNLAVFADAAATFRPEMVAATSENKKSALDFLRNSELGGGTDVRKALSDLRKSTTGALPPERHIVVLTDAEPTRSPDGKTSPRDLFANSDFQTRIHALIIGNRNGASFLEEAAKLSGGFVARMRETDDTSFHTSSINSVLAEGRITNARFIGDESMFHDVYQVGDTSGAGTSIAFVGRYRPGNATNIRLSADGPNTPLVFEKTVELPLLSSEHSHLPALWARARIDALLREIDRDGESAAKIEEIIALSQKFRIVTPYTAFLAAPRALLRPRVIQPGDPVIRVRTDESAIRVTAVLPHGETLPLRYIENEKVWQTRFLAPDWMKDGEYRCRLLIELKSGEGFEESRTFTIDGRAPTIVIDPELRIVRAGESFLLKVRADKDTARIRASLGSGTPVSLVWSDREKACVGMILVPAALPGGKHALRVRAEDFARNESMAETELTVIGN